MACVAFAGGKRRGWPLWLVGAVRVVLCFHAYRGMARIPVAQFAREAAVEEIARVDLQPWLVGHHLHINARQLAV